jgi:hypothetical protein
MEVSGSITFRPLNLQRELLPVVTRLDGLQSQSAYIGEEKSPYR